MPPCRGPVTTSSVEGRPRRAENFGRTLRAWIDRRLTNVQVARILGVAYFEGLLIGNKTNGEPRIVEPSAFVPILLSALQIGEEIEAKASLFTEDEPCSVTNLQIRGHSSVVDVLLC